MHPLGQLVNVLINQEKDRLEIIPKTEQKSGKVVHIMQRGGQRYRDWRKYVQKSVS